MSDLVAIAIMLGAAAVTTATDQAAKAVVLGSHTGTVAAGRRALVGIRATLNQSSVPARISNREGVVIFIPATSLRPPPPCSLVALALWALALPSAGWGET
jgi:hypothetical protein